MKARPAHALLVALFLISFPEASNQQYYGGGRGYEGRSAGYPDYGRDYGRDYYDYRYPNYNAYNGYQRNYYDDYYNRGGRSYDGYGWNPRYDYDVGRRYPVTPGYGNYDYFYGRSSRDSSVRNVDPFPGKYLGLGSVQYSSGGRDVELLCTLSKDGQKVVSNVVWVKVENAYRYPGPPGGPEVNPYYCPSGGCIYRQVDYSNRRFFADLHGDVATLHIYDTEPQDHGVYRCSAAGQTSKATETETTFQIVEYFN
ncbi:uncharacterized protein LOC100897295 [Galendromus occidentalis]|uniref:Uncharacterized protein LOC100897295 n=1 Tax=Galendromus occidentalis TaxID=34638 RepID=A0AAJ6QPX8_9ACAR|nr:uncharacterized protein LOC100897295 [Galendromus occidentalis]